MDILFFICLAAFMFGIMLTIAEMIIDTFNEEFDNINVGGKNGGRKQDR